MLNESGKISSLGFSELSFASNGQMFTKIAAVTKAFRTSMYYDDVMVATGDVGDDYFYWQSWSDEVYRTLSFTSSPTGDFLAWLQENGTKQ